jgi:hypothetical protein
MSCSHNLSTQISLLLCLLHAFHYLSRLGLDDHEFPLLDVLILHCDGHIIVEVVDVFGCFPKNFIDVVFWVQQHCVFIRQAGNGDVGVDTSGKHQKLGSARKGVGS